MNPRYSAFPKFPGLWEMVELQQKWPLPEALKGKLEKCRPWWYSPTASNTPHASSPACIRGVSLHGLIPQLRKIKKFQKLNPDLAGLVHKNLRLLFRSKSWFQCLAELFLRMKPSWPHRPIASSFKPKHTGRLPCLHWATNCPFHLGKPGLCYDDPMLHQLDNSSTPVPRTCCLQWSSHVVPPKEMPRKFSKVSKHCFKKNMQFGWKKVCLIWYEYILYNKYIYVHIYIWSPPEDLPKSFFNCIYNIKCVLSYTKFPTIWVIPSNCRCHKTLKNTVYLYMPFSKLVRNHLLFVF